MKHLEMKISGMVQGVWFRASARDKAVELGLTGFARNETDGSVFIEAEGPAETLQDFLKWAQNGPERARVDHVEYLFDDELKHFTNFNTL